MTRGEIEKIAMASLSSGPKSAPSGKRLSISSPTLAISAPSKRTEPARGFHSPMMLRNAVIYAWRDAKVHLPLVSHVNGELFGRPDAGTDMTFDFATLIAHAAKSRDLTAGTIVGSGTVSNKEDGGPGRPVAAGGRGYACIAEQRTVETILAGKASTPFLRFGDRVRIEMLDASGHTVFGAIDQVVRQGA